MIVREYLKGGPNLFQILNTLDAFRASLSASQRRQQQSGENGYDGDYHQQFHQRESRSLRSVKVPEISHTPLFQLANHVPYSFMWILPRFRRNNSWKCVNFTPGA
jgi:hypothetical protein